MPLRTVAIALLFLPAACLVAAPKSDKAPPPYDTSRWVGANYTPAYCVNQVQMWHEFRGDAGLIFRVNDPGKGNDRMRGYYAGFTTDKLYLGRMNNNWKELATFDLAKLPSAPKANGWSLLRIAVEGRRIRVWLNATHDDPGLRIDCTDKGKDAILTGSVGVRTNSITAWFDDIVVLPISELPKPVKIPTIKTNK